MEVLVQKFGGTSVASYEKMKEVCKIIEAHKEKYKDIAVVVSAMGRKGAPYATDTLIGMCTNINDRPTKRELDMIMWRNYIRNNTSNYVRFNGYTSYIFNWNSSWYNNYKGIFKC